ncbi:resolvase [Octadecabacter antarcticus 307]|uniref:Resolvase n=1 Tax=Octadecabacter antarcticus 307 TaxID=391626 RepID=M9RA10_9RHOB|nr:recombinase family protein [Octadecabacter antarcticus]AGI69017.1 resolvase [Octadecabacter antarcticus 307]
MKIGYRRVSTVDQNLDRQDLGNIDKIFEEKLSAATAKDRPELQSMINFARDGDEVIVWSIDRMARDLRDLQTIIQTLNDKNVSITFLSENLKFSVTSNDPFAKLQLHLMGAFAEFERTLIKKRQAEGIAKAKVKGIYRGRRASIDADKIMALHAQGLGPTKIANQMGISRVSVYRALKAAAAYTQKAHTQKATDISGKWSNPTSSYEEAMTIKKLVRKHQN